MKIHGQRAGSILSAILVLCAPVFAESLEKISLENMGTMLAEGHRVEAFRHMERTFPVETIHRGDATQAFKEAPQNLGDVMYEWAGESRSVSAFLDETTTTGFLVLKGDAIVYEKYFRGNDKNSLATSMSVAKSFTSALVGIAIEEGHIKNIDESITKYLPELKGSGYKGVSIRHILQMSSGIDFSEVYDDDTSDVILMMGQIGTGKSVVEYAAGLGSKQKPGKVFSYASINTNVLGMLIEKTTGKNPAQYLEEKIWKKLGMESDATWGTDNHGNVMTFAWLNVTARDYAKFGRLYLNDGEWNGEQIVPAAWVRESVVPGKEYLKLKDHYVEGWDIGYQYQWWVPAGDDGEFTGIGVWGQYVYVNRAQNLVIVKNSVDPLFDTRDQETIAAFRAIGNRLGGGEQN